MTRDGSPDSGGRPISIHIPRVGDDRYRYDDDAIHLISIHIPRVGDDLWGGGMSMAESKISIHIPRVGDDGLSQAAFAAAYNFNPHPPCGG